ncbi:SusC/RagA family TonB-linked outer membrane protein [Lacibacter luteus]|uniref:SusC/RagA family TonB-linked outer membrane protein n=1 Tax=Lacibacter luteus TaxID=2508719 RepID=A0A4Q1CJ61_9BACT|nr:SusC/RagA family TonB-linked outer membrane protein [Lacibacter luteus]RXK60367.1 SusC/RagA family TonB-linked outer membrane protein [Lacibacter luteus]
MRKLLALTIVLLLSFCQVWAQTKEVKGKVVDGRDGTPVAGATITANGRSVGVTSAAGEFSINVSAATKKLVFSSIGFNDLEVTITGETLNVSMTAGESKAISEVVVTGYTTLQRKKFAGATANVAPAEVRKQPFGSFDQALQGQAAGISVAANSGQPGANAVVRIRGNGSINGGNVPLYIMDGIEITAADFATINQGDFERVEVLKDAVATAQYGSRGANGVIVISTRKGRAGQIQLNYDAQLGFSNLPKDRLVLMNSKEKIDYELQRGNPYQWTTAQADSLRKVNFSWRDALFRTGVTQQHQISASGGSTNSRFFASLSYMDQEGIVKTTGLKRYTARINVDNTIKNFRFGMNMQVGFSRITATGEGNTTLSTPLNAIRWSNPYERDYNPLTGDFQQFGGAGYLTSGQPNGAMELYLDYNYSNQLKGIATSYLEYNFPFLKGLTARTNWGVDYSNVESAAFNDPRTAGAQARNGSLGRSSGYNFRYTGTTSLNYKETFGKHEVEGGLFTEVVKNQSRSFGFTAYGFTNGFRNEAGITQGSTANANYIPAVSGSGTRNGILSYFGIFNYGYDEKYYVTLVGRRDGSSRFGVNNRFANFGSAGITWSVTNEDFMKDVNFLDDLRLRASIGTNGNNNTAAGDFVTPQFGAVSYGGVSGWAPSSAGNLNYRWETNRTINFGVDFAILKRRLSGTVELYDRKTTDLFASDFIDPQNSGFGSIQSNFGSLRNRGIEITLRGEVFNSKDFNWTITGNITYNQNRIIDLIQDSVVTGVTILKEGKPLNTLYLVEYAGVNPANGNAQYVNKFDKSVTMAYSASYRNYFGTTDAPWFGGITSSWSYKGFDLSAQLNFFLDRVQYNNDKNNLTNPTYFYDNMHVEVLKEWRQPGDITNVPRPSSGATTLGPSNPYQSQTTRFLEDASFWRLRNVTLGYTFDSKLLAKAKIRTARLFVQGQNWWTATKFQSFDPETTGTSLVGAQYPALIQTTIGLSIGF